MSSRVTKTSLEHIIESSDSIFEFLVGINLAAYKADRKTNLAVERQLQNLTEAAFHLGKDAETLCPTVDWRNIRGPGNALRHEYDDIVDQISWEAIHDRLPPLRSAVEVALHPLNNEGTGPS